MRSMSSNRSTSQNSRDRSRTERGRSNEKRSGSKNNNKQYTNCIGCKCEDCEKMRETAKELNVNLCEEFEVNEEIQVNFTEKGNQLMILDLGAPVSLAGYEWIKQYLEDHGLELKDLKSFKCHQRLKFGPSKQYISKLMVELPVLVRRLDGKEDVLKVLLYP